MTLNKKQKIIVNARFLTQPITGVQRFAIEISKELKKAYPGIVFACPKNVLHYNIFSELEACKIGNLEGHLWEQIELMSFVNSRKALLISLCNTAPLFVEDQIVTIHDLSFIHNPKWFSFIFRKYYNFLIPRLARKAKHIVTVSETSKTEINEVLGVDSNKITVVYNAVPQVFNSKINKINSTKKEMGRYILTVASHHPRKNFKRLIEAFTNLCNSEVKLIIVGNFNKNFKDESLAEYKSVIFKENIDDNKLIELYLNADLFVYSSLYEGFGIPIIEAMSLGVPVCVSNISVFKEICESNATYFDPHSSSSILQAITHALQNPRDNIQLMKIAKEVTEKFSWEKSAKNFNLIITEILN